MGPKEVEAVYYDWECRQFLRRQNKDLALLTSLAQAAGGTVLELGCGSGRVTMRLAEAGVEVVGLDYSRPMLDCLRGKLERADPSTAARAQLIEANLTSFDLGQKFPLIVAPYNILCYLLSPEELNSCLRMVRAHLQPGGRFFCQVSDIGRDKESQSDWKLLTVDYLAAEGGGPVVAMYERIRLEETTRIVNFDERYVLFRPDGVKENHEFTLRMRSIEAREMKAAFAEVGFYIAQAYSDLDLSPMDDENASTQIYIAGVRE